MRDSLRVEGGEGVCRYVMSFNCRSLVRILKEETHLIVAESAQALSSLTENLVQKNLHDQNSGQNL